MDIDRKTAFSCQGCGGDVFAKNDYAYDLLMKGHPALCDDCRNPKPKAWASYEDYLLSPEWRTKANERKRLDGYKCRICSSGENLECHHRTYDRLYNEDIEDLTTLCATDHWLVTAYDKGLIQLPPRPKNEKVSITAAMEPEKRNGRTVVYIPPITIG